MKNTRFSAHYGPRKLIRMDLNIRTYMSNSRSPGYPASEFHGIALRYATSMVARFDLLCDERFGGCHEDDFAFREPPIVYE